jgi:uncharacterized membrane protein
MWFRWWSWPLPLKPRTPAQQRRDRIVGVALVAVAIATFAAWLGSGLDGSPSKIWFRVFLYAASFAVMWWLLRIGAPALWASPVYRQVRRFGFPLIGLVFGLQVGYGRHHNGLGTKAGIIAGVAFGAVFGLREWLSPPATPVRAAVRDAIVGPVVHLRLSRDEVESQLGIRFDDEWDGAKFVAHSSFDVAGVGRVTLVANPGEQGVELHLEPGTTVTLEQLAQGLGLSPAHLV